MENKIIQIIPLTKPVIATYKGANSTFKSVIYIAGLTSEGEVIFLDSDESGHFEDPKHSDNFLKYSFMDWMSK